MSPGGSLTIGTTLSRVISGVLVVGYLTQLAVPSSRQYLALVAGRFIPCVWSIFTAGLLETHLGTLTFNVVALLVLARNIEPLWGAKEFLKFLAITNLAAGLASLFFLYVAFAVTATGLILWTEVSGFQGSIAACFVAIKNVLPDTEITLLKVLKFNAKHLPGVYVIVSIGIAIFSGSSLTVLPQILVGTYSAWFYLRYWQVKQGLNLRGDPSTEFRFASFFPEMMQPPIDNIAGICARLFRVQSAETSSSNAAFAMQGKPLPGSDTSEAARRRERGAKVLEERLKASLGTKQDVVDIEAPAVSPEKPSNGADYL